MPPRIKTHPANEPKKSFKIASTLLYLVGFACFLHVVFVGPPKRPADAQTSTKQVSVPRPTFGQDDDLLQDDSPPITTKPPKKIDVNAPCPEPTGEEEEKSVYRKEFEKHYPVKAPYDRTQDFDSIQCSNIPRYCNLTDTKWGNPFIMISFGRAGTTSTWDIIAGLTGEFIPKASEDEGKDKHASEKFFASRNQTEHGKCWLQRLLCEKLGEVKYAYKKGLGRASMYGTKWKPWHLGFNTTQAREALQWLGTQPQIKVVHNTRNMVDMYISQHKHRVLAGLFGKDRQAHCYDDRELQLSEKSWAKLLAMGIPRDTPCAKIFKEIEARTATEIPHMLAYFEKNVLQTDYVIEMLDFYNVSRVKVTYEKLYFREDAEEWMRIFRYLGYGPQHNLTLDQVFAKTTFQKTSANDRSKRMANYDEVVEALRCTRYAEYLD